METAAYIDQIEQLSKEQDDIYHKAAVSFGLSDTALWVLYTVAHAADKITQQDLCRICFYPKQTVNSAINSLIAGGYVILEPIPETKKSKRIVLTDSGKIFAGDTACRLREAELRAYGRFSAEELQHYLEMTARLTDFLREETEKLYVQRGIE